MTSVRSIIVEKNGTLKESVIKDYDEDKLFKKCGFKKESDFGCRAEWSQKLDGKKYFIKLFAKDKGKANFENKYDFPPPVDNVLFFNNCILIMYSKNKDEIIYENLTIPIWEKIYEKLFGGFENLDVTCYDDENEEDELENIPKHKKTKEGYLKDDFVVDNSDESSSIESESEELDDSLDEEEELEFGNELTEEEYEV